MVVLKVLLLLIVLGFLFCIVVAVRLVWSARHLFQMFRGGHTSRREEGTYGNTVNTGDGTIVDRRSPQEAGRKIIADDEGEYVEFEETS